MSWRQFIRELEADARRRQRAAARAHREAVQAERAAMRRFRDLQRAERELAKQSEKIRAAHEAQQFENYLELLVSVHKDCGETWEWSSIVNAHPPTPPVRADRHESAARAFLEHYHPGFFERLFGGAKKKIAAMNDDIDRGRTMDDTEFKGATQAYQAAYEEWNALRTVAGRILAADASAYPTALELTGALDELSAFQTKVAVTNAELDAVEFMCTIMDDDLVPREEVKLTASGKLSTKNMAAGKYWALYQDHVCSAALRVAREAFAVLPVSRAVVNIGPYDVNKANGHREVITYLGVHVARPTIAKLNLAEIDPSESMKNFPHRMKFKKTAGFEPVEAMTLDEQWVTT